MLTRVLQSAMLSKYEHYAKSCFDFFAELPRMASRLRLCPIRRRFLGKGGVHSGEDEDAKPNHSHPSKSARKSVD
jgi:hypothetical protein